MPFDAFAPEPALKPLSQTMLIDGTPTPDADWAEANADRFLAFLYVAPQPCEGLDRLIA